MLIDQLKKDRMEYMKARNEGAKDLLSVVISEANALAKNKDNRPFPSDEEVVKTIEKQIKILEENLQALKEKPDFAQHSERMNGEISLLKKYLPSRLSEAQLEQEISAIVAGLDKPNLGAIMKALKEKFPGQYDGALASKIGQKLVAGK
ncbi:MAG: GatB/YqeY domain-containing protein [Candidatus Sumerlaeota bacterium]|nr:GatB/YqeY domain-containing protein [Candidatus Sumerlaeota bacterium]